MSGRHDAHGNASRSLSALVRLARARGLDAALHDPLGSAETTPVGGVRCDSRFVEAGDLFLALPGTRVDGAVYVEEARRRGAVAVVCEPRHAPADLPAVVSDDVASAAGFLASAFEGDPSDALDVVAVTGTNGKTSCTYLLEAVWRAAGRTPGIVGTIVQRCDAFELPAPMTTPSAVDLQHVLSRMREAGCDAVAIEASSHALDQGRVAGCRFRAAIFTNLTRDHLDYHGDEDRYFAAKAALFRRWLDPGAAAVLNADDPRVAALAPELAHLDVWTFSTSPSTSPAASSAPTSAASPAASPAASVPARVRVRTASCTLAGIDAELDLDGEPVTVHSPLIGAANLSNIVAVAAAARAIGIAPDAIATGLSACPAVPGRMERVVVGTNAPAVFVDYAHTPDALERSLRALAEQKTGRLIVVFGCGGDRDRGKRPIMGRIASELADVAVLTSDNPRTEPPQAILQEIEAGIDGGTGARMPASTVQALAARHSRGYLVEADRLRAIDTAIAIAAPDDVVLVAGKGHEDYQDTAGQKRHFDDREVARAALGRLQQELQGELQGQQTSVVEAVGMSGNTRS